MTDLSENDEVFEGVARRRGLGDGPLVSRVVVRKRKKELGRVEFVEPFDIELPDGQRLGVSFDRAVTVLPVTKQHGRWSELKGEVALPQDEARRIAPQTKVELIRSVVLDGAKVAITSAESEYAFSEAPAGGGAIHRAAPERTRIGLVAKAIASGSDPRALLEAEGKPLPRARPRPHLPPTPANATTLQRTATLSVALAGAIVLGAALTVPFGPLTVDLACSGLVLLAVAAVHQLIDRMPEFIYKRKPARKGPDRALTALILTATLGFSILLCPCLVMDLADAFKARPEVNVSHGSCLGLFLTLGGLGVALAFLQRTTLASLRLLARAPRLDPPLAKVAGRWGAFEGWVRDPTPVKVPSSAAGLDRAAVVHIVDETVVGGSDPNIYVERVLSEGTFFVEGDAGASVEIDPRAGRWTSTFRSRRRTGSQIAHVQLVPIGGAVLAVGEISVKEDAIHLGASDTHPLVFLATRGDDRPRDVVARLLFLHRSTMIALFALTLAGPLLFAFVEPRLPAFHMGTSDE